jgi:hypothetical protein
MSLRGDGDEDEDEYNNTTPIACVYSSETGVWGNIIAAADQCELADSNPGILVGNVLYWSSKSVSNTTIFIDDLTDDIVEFDLDRQSLAVIKGPPCLNFSLRHQIIRAEDDALGLAIFSHCRFEVWQRMVNCHGGTTWLLHNAFETRTLLGLPPRIRGMKILGYDEDNDAIFLFVDANVYMVQLLSMQFRRLYESCYPINCHPFASFYAPGDCSSLVLSPCIVVVTSSGDVIYSTWLMEYICCASQVFTNNLNIVRDKLVAVLLFLCLYSSEVPNQMSNEELSWRVWNLKASYVSTICFCIAINVFSTITTCPQYLPSEIIVLLSLIEDPCYKLPPHKKYIQFLVSNR